MNCETIQLREVPKAFTTTSSWRHVAGTRVNSPGHSKNVKDIWIIRSEVTD